MWIPSNYQARAWEYLVVSLEDHAHSAVRGLQGHGLIELLFSLEVGRPVLPQLAQGLGPGLCLLSLFLRGQLFRGLCKRK